MDDLDDEQGTGDYLKVPPKTLRQWRYLNQGPRYVKVGRHVRYRRSDVDAWLSRQSRGAA